MGSDEESAIKIKADQMLSEIDSRYPGFIQVSYHHQVNSSRASNLKKLVGNSSFKLFKHQI